MAGKVRHFQFVDGRYYARRVVPVELREIIGKRELQAPLGADRRAALNQLPVALVSINLKLDHARQILEERKQALAATLSARSTPMPPADLAKMHYEERLALDLAMRQAGPNWASVGINDLYVQELRNLLAGRLSNEQIASVIGLTMERYRRRGSVGDPFTPEWRASAMAVAGAELEALERVVERDEGIAPANQVHPTHLAPAPEPAQKLEIDEPVSLRGLLETHLRALEREGRGRAGRKAWPRVFDDLLQFLRRHRKQSGPSLLQADDARRLTRQELTAWRDEKLQTLSAKTVKDVWMASVKATLQRAVEDHKLDVNPAAMVKVRSSPKVFTRPKGYTDAEALAILTACRNYNPVVRENERTNESAHITAAKRWGPWLCAFTGARVTEIMQLRRSDVQEESGIHFLRITPDAGSVKTRAYRDVPLHPQLIELGFLEFVDKCTTEPLFYSEAAHLEKRPAEVSSGRLSTWLRKSGLTPPGVQPNHAWRHRFKTQSIDLALNPRVVDAIQGHTGRTASDGYGDVSLRAKANAISMLPSYCSEATE
jgi:integrase